MFWFRSTASLWAAWLLALYLCAGSQVTQTASGRQPLVLSNQHIRGRSLQSREIKFDDEDEDGPTTRDSSSGSAPPSLLVARTDATGAANGTSWKYSPQVFVTLDSTTNFQHQPAKARVKLFGQRKHKNPSTVQQHQDDYYGYKLHHQPATHSSLFSPATVRNTKKKEKCPGSESAMERPAGLAKQFSELSAEQSTNDATTSWTDADKGADKYLPEKLSVRLGNDIRVRSDLLLVRTPDSLPHRHGHSGDTSHNGAPIIRGLEVRNLSGSWLVGDGFEQRTEPLIVKLPADGPTQKELLPDYLATVALDESHLQSREDNQPGTETVDTNSVRGQLVVRASSSASQGIRVIQEPGALGLVMNQRGLIVAPKRSSYPNHHSSSSSMYNPSSLFTNHIDHSLNPVKVTPLAETPPVLEVSWPAFLGQRPPLVSSTRWRNTTRVPSLMAPQESLQHHDSSWLELLSRPQSNHHYSTTNTLSSTSAATSLSPDRETSHITTQRPAPSTSLPPQFLHNPPYKQNLVNPNLDLASSQQLVQEYDQKLASRMKLKQQSNKRPTGADPSASPVALLRPNANRFTASPIEFAPAATSNHSVVKEQSNSSSSYSHEPLPTKPPFEINSTISSQLNTLAGLNHNNDQPSANVSALAPATTSHPMKPSLTSPSAGANGGGKFMNKLQHLIIGKILKNQAAGTGAGGSGSSNGAGSSITYGYHQSSPPTPTSLVPQQQPATPAPLLSSTVANNVASLIAQKLSSIFVKSVAPSLVASGYIVSPAAVGQSNVGINPLSGLSTGLSSLFGHRNGGSPNRLSTSMKQRFPNNIHSPVKRRTVGMGSLLASGLIYGISLLPALMALTGINPLAGSSRTSNLPSSTQADVKSYSVANSQQMSSPSTTSVKKLPAPQNVVATSGASNQVPPIQGTVAYLVPLISTIPDSPDVGDSLVVNNVVPLEHLPYGNSQSNEPIQFNDITHHSRHHVSELEYVHNLATNPMAPHVANIMMHNPLPPHIPSIPYPKYKGHLYYSRPLPPGSTNNWPDGDRDSSQPSAAWDNPRKKTNGYQDSNRKEPIRLSSPLHGSPPYHTNTARGGHNQPVSHQAPPVQETFSTPAAAPSRTFQVGYTLSYKPLPETRSQQPSHHHHDSYIEFQDVNDLVDDGAASQWRPLIAQRGFTSKQAKFNLNQSPPDDFDSS